MGIYYSISCSTYILTTCLDNLVAALGVVEAVSLGVVAVVVHLLGEVVVVHLLEVVAVVVRLLGEAVVGHLLEVVVVRRLQVQLLCFV